MEIKMDDTELKDYCDAIIIQLRRIADALEEGIVIKK